MQAIYNDFDWIYNDLVQDPHRRKHLYLEISLRSLHHPKTEVQDNGRAQWGHLEEESDPVIVR